MLKACGLVRPQGHAITARYVGPDGPPARGQTECELRRPRNGWSGGAMKPTATKRVALLPSFTTRSFCLLPSAGGKGPLVPGRLLRRIRLRTAVWPNRLPGADGEVLEGGAGIVKISTQGGPRPTAHPVCQCMRDQRGPDGQRSESPVPAPRALERYTLGRNISRRSNPVMPSWVPLPSLAA